MIAVFDIDGVLADATHRQHHVESRPKDWDAFFAAVGEDPVIEAGRARLLEAAGEHEIVVVSGRPERTRADTEAWLERGGMGRPRVVLRPDHDRRPAADLKADLLVGVGSPDEVVLIVDDDPSVVERVTGLGYRAELF
ncbi:MAG: hypothetical protein WCP95_00565 [Actinomycetes bacterium]